MKRLLLASVAVWGLTAPALAATAPPDCPALPGTIIGVDAAGNCVFLVVNADGSINTTSSGGGGGGPATIADGADVAEGTTTDAAATQGSTGSVSAKLRTVTSQLNTGNGSLATIATNTGAATPAGTNVIGKVGIDQTTPGTTNGVQVNAALPAGTNVIGHTINDTGSTTAVTGNVTVVQGTGTNLHVVNDAGAAVIGHVIADTGSTTAVTGNVTAVQATGTNLHAVLDTTSTTAVTQATGTNLHAVLDTTSTTAVTQATGSNLHAQLDSGSTTAATQATGTNLHTVTDATSVTQLVPATTGGLTTFTLTAANTTNATNIKASAGQVYHISAYNNSATLAWVSFYNNSGTPTCGSSIIDQVMIPANSTSGSGAVEEITLGRAFSSGIAICVTTGIAGTGAVAASAYVINVDYK